MPPGGLVVPKKSTHLTKGAFPKGSVPTIQLVILFLAKQQHPESNRNPGHYPVHLPLVGCSQKKTPGPKDTGVRS